MKKQRSYFYKDGPIELTARVYEDHTPGAHDYGLSRPEWTRACAILARHGFDQALAMMDGKAERAIARGDIPICVRWRNLMAAVHAIGSDEPLLCDRIH